MNEDEAKKRKEEDEADEEDFNRWVQDEFGTDQDGPAESSEGRAIPGARAPRQPNQEERNAHYRSGHLPRRRWCAICVKACGISSPHSQSSSSSPLYPILSCDTATLEPQRRQKQIELHGQNLLERMAPNPMRRRSRLVRDPLWCCMTQSQVLSMQLKSRRKVRAMMQ